MRVFDIGRVVLVVDDEGEPKGLELLFEERAVTTPDQAAEALDGLRRALDSSSWVANTMLRVVEQDRAETSVEAEVEEGGGAHD